MTVKELKKLAKASGVKGYSKMRKAELEKVLNIQETKSTLTVKILRQLAKANGIKGYSRMNKAQLLAIVNGETVSAQAKEVAKVEKNCTLADVENAFAKYEKKHFGFVRICDIKRELADFTADSVTEAIRAARDSEKYQLLVGDVTLETPEEVAMRFVDENGFRLGIMTTAA